MSYTRVSKLGSGYSRTRGSASSLFNVTNTCPSSSLELVASPVNTAKAVSFISNPKAAASSSTDCLISALLITVLVLFCVWAWAWGVLCAVDVKLVLFAILLIMFDGEPWVTPDKTEEVLNKKIILE